MNLKIGDVVCLNSGGPPMTVQDVGVRVTCVWFDADGILRHHEFAPGLLKGMVSDEARSTALTILFDACGLVSILSELASCCEKEAVNAHSDGDSALARYWTLITRRLRDIEEMQPPA